MSVLIKNSCLHYQICEFDTDIKILVWIIGSTCIQKRGNFEAKVEYQQAIILLLLKIVVALGVIGVNLPRLPVLGRPEECDKLDYARSIQHLLLRAYKILCIY